jgi:hypothetical protein
VINIKAVNFPEIAETLTQIVFSSAIIPVADAIKQPLVQTLIKEGITLSERWEEVIGSIFSIV